MKVCYKGDFKKCARRNRDKHGKYLLQFVLLSSFHMESFEGCLSNFIFFSQNFPKMLLKILTSTLSALLLLEATVTAQQRQPPGVNPQHYQQNQVGMPL